MVPGPALAHKASDEGIIAVEDSAGMDVHPIDYAYVPAVTFCHPQVASFGLSEKAAKEAGYDVVVGKIPMGAVGAPTVYGDRGGMIKIVGDKQYGELLGASIVSVKAADLIQELVNARELEGGVSRGRADHPRAPVVRRGGHGGRPGDGRLAESTARALPGRVAVRLYGGGVGSSACASLRRSPQPELTPLSQLEAKPSRSTLRLRCDTGAGVLPDLWLVCRRSGNVTI
jgi:hypothetical protein